MRIILSLCILLLTSHASLRAVQAANTTTPDIQMQNMHLTLDIYLSNDLRSRGLAGAAWMRFRNNSGAPISKLDFLINPGLRVTKIVGVKNSTLSYREESIALTGGVNVKRVSLTLPRPVDAKDSAEFSVQYQGDLTNLGLAGPDYVQDSLTPPFTMIRPDSLIYPVITQNNNAPIAYLKASQRFKPTARITVPQGYSLGGNAVETSRKLKGVREEIELRVMENDYGLVLGLAPFREVTGGITRIFYLPENEASAREFALRAEDITQQISSYLGPLEGAPRYMVADLGRAFEAQDGPRHSFVGFGDYAAVSLETILPDLWQINNTTSSAGGWHVAITDRLKKQLGGANDRDSLYQAVKAALTSPDDLKKRALKDYAEAGFAAEATGAYGLMFALLADLLGEDAYWGALRAVQGEFGTFGASDEELLDFLKDTIKDRKARKLMVDWIDKGRIVRDLNASEDFTSLADRYR